MKKMAVMLAILRFSFARADAYETSENRKIASMKQASSLTPMLKRDCHVLHRER